MLPESVTVLGKTYTIEGATINDKSSGECDSIKQHIKIDMEWHSDMQQDTLLHEIVHAIDDQLNLKMGERRVNNMATGILAVMKDNPQICRFIFGAYS